MEEIVGGDAASCLAYFTGASMAWSNWIDDPTTMNYVAWQIAESLFVTQCVQPF